MGGKGVKVLLTGGKGMLGRTICRELTDFEVIPTDLPEADITDEEAIDAVVRDNHPDAVIHCAAMTAVDKCEEAVDLAYRLNALGSANVASACNRHGVRLIAISTDYVFDGDADRPYTEFDKPSGGRTVYGKSKFAGEEQVRAFLRAHPQFAPCDFTVDERGSDGGCYTFWPQIDGSDGFFAAKLKRER